jgi:tRNA/tmRNA/rRNA uracil-C5-methylase (TrmA/RlmC/RlmD family)
MRCPILTEPLQEALGRLAAQLALAPPDMGAEEVDREWELVQGGGGETRIHRLGADGGGTPGPTAGDRIALDVGGERVLLSPGTFAQSNALLLELLHAAVRRRVDGGADLLELYAGAGFFTLALARRFERVHVVEAAGTALGDLRHNLQRAGLRNVTVDGRRVEDALGQGVRSRPDVVFLDPPRVGLARGSAESLAQLGASRIVYLSCDPATLARDMAILIERGYSLESVEGFDLFPQTPHVEALATLTIR